MQMDGGVHFVISLWLPSRVCHFPRILKFVAKKTIPITSAILILRVSEILKEKIQGVAKRPTSKDSFWGKKKEKKQMVKP